MEIQDAVLIQVARQAIQNDERLKGWSYSSASAITGHAADSGAITAYSVKFLLERFTPEFDPMSTERQTPEYRDVLVVVDAITGVSVFVFTPTNSL